MARSTVDIWNAGGKELAILILIFSGIWPYLKQISTLVLWFVPPRMVSVSKRGSVLLWLDALAKWSMVDIFVLVVVVAGFRVSIQRYACMCFIYILSFLVYAPRLTLSCSVLVVPMSVFFQKTSTALTF